MAINYNKIMTKAAEKAGINTRNGDTYFLEEKPVAGEKLLKMTRTIIEEVESEIRQRVQEELNVAGYYDDEEEGEYQELGTELPVEESYQESGVLEQELLLTIESAFEKNNKVIEAQTDRIIRKIEELNNKSEGENPDYSEQYDKAMREFKERVRNGMSRDEETDKKELENKILKQLKEAKPSRGASNAPRVVSKLLEQQSLEISNREIANKTRTSINSVRDTVKYIATNVDCIDYVVRMQDGRKQGFLKVKSAKD